VASIANVLLLIFVSVFNVAVLSPVVKAMERRLGWSRGRCAAVLVLGVVIVIAAVVLVLTQAIAGAVRGFSHDLPQIVGTVRHSDLGAFINGGSGSLDTLRQHASDITRGVGKVSGGVAHIGVSAFGAVTLVFSVIFLTLFGLVDEPRVRDWIGGLLYRDTRDRYLQVTDRIVQTTSRYMLGNLAISVICGTVYGITAAILGLPYPLAIAVIAGILDLVPTIGATIAGVITGIVALSVSVEALIAFVIVIVVYQQIENYILQPTIEGGRGLRLHRACQRPGVRGALRDHRRDHRRARRGRASDRRRGAHRRQKSSHRRRRRRGAAATGLTARLTLPRASESRRTRDDASSICR
jgi:predicted PurR-regulated permease PerM